MFLKYKSLIVGVSMLAVASAQAGGKDEEDNVGEGLVKAAVLLAAKFSVDHENLGHKAQLVQKILININLDEDEKHKRISALYGNTTPEMVEEALKVSYVQQFFSYKTFCDKLEELKHISFFSADYLPTDMLNMILVNGSQPQITTLLKTAPVARRVENELNTNSPRVSPKVILAYYGALMQEDTQKTMEDLAKKKMDESQKVSLLARLFVVDYKLLDKISKLTLSQEAKALFKKAEPQIFEIDMSGDMGEQLAKLKPHASKVLIKNFAKDKIADLLNNPNILKIDLASNEMGLEETQALVELLEKNSTIISLDLSRNKIGDAGVKALSKALEKNSTLTIIELGFNNISDEGVEVLSKALETNSTLTSLSIWGNIIGNRGAQALSKALEKDSTIISLDLNHNLIGDKGAQALAKALETNSTLTFLSLVNTKIGTEGKSALEELKQKRPDLKIFY